LGACTVFIGDCIHRSRMLMYVQPVCSDGTTGKMTDRLRRDIFLAVWRNPITGQIVLDDVLTRPVPHDLISRLRLAYDDRSAPPGRHWLSPLVFTPGSLSYGEALRERQGLSKVLRQ